MDLKLPKSNEPDIFNYGFDNSLNIPTKDTGTPTVYDMIDNQIAGGQVSTATTTNIATLTRTVSIVNVPQSSNDTTEELLVTRIDDGSTGPNAALYYDSPTPAAGNDIASLSFLGNNSTDGFNKNAKITYSYITTYIGNITKDSESAYLTFFQRDGARIGSFSNLSASQVVNRPTLSLSNSTANSIFTSTVGSNSHGGGMINWTVTATDGTDYQTRTGVTTWSAVNKGGVFTTAVTEIGSSVAVSAGTLTGTWSITTSGTTVTLKFTPTSSLTTTSINLYVTHNAQRGRFSP